MTPMKLFIRHTLYKFALFMTTLKDFSDLEEKYVLKPVNIIHKLDNAYF